MMVRQSYWVGNHVLVPDPLNGLEVAIFYVSFRAFEFLWASWSWKCSKVEVVSSHQNRQQIKYPENRDLDHGPCILCSMPEG